MTEPVRPAWFERPAFFYWTTALAVFVFLAAILLPVRSDQHTGGSGSLVSAKLLALANVMYSADNDDRMPPAQVWEDATSQYMGSRSQHQLYFSEGEGKSKKKFAFFDAVSCVTADYFTDPTLVPLVFQSVLTGKNAHGTLEEADWPLGGKCFVGFLDSHANGMPKSWRYTAIVLRRSH